MPKGVVNFRRASAYVALLAPSLVVASALWMWLAPDRLYHCWDDMGPMTPSQSATLVFSHPLGALGLLINFVPPFVHSGGPRGDGESDHFIWPAPLVYLVWLGLAALAFLLPALIMRGFSRLYRGDEKIKTHQQIA